MAVLGAGAVRAAASGPGVTRVYRADAVVTLLSIPIFSRESVGGAKLTIDVPRDGSRPMVLRFLAGSWPERAGGVNRFGFIEESIWETASGREAACFGFMTSSPETTLDGAKAKLGASGDGAALDVMHVSGRDGRFRVAEWQERIPANYRWTEGVEIAERYRAIPRESGFPVKRHDVTLRETNTFLNAVREAILSPALESKATFVHNGKAYRLETRKQSDRDAGSKFEEKAITASAGRVVRLTGKIQALHSGERSTFRLWYEAGGETAFPIRFEFRARSFLKLAFEREALHDEVAK
jgi:hypothetical protein